MLGYLFVCPRQAVDPMIVAAYFRIEKAKQFDRTLALFGDRNRGIIRQCGTQLLSVTQFKISAGHLDRHRRHETTVITMHEETKILFRLAGGSRPRMKSIVSF